MRMNQKQAVLLSIKPQWCSMIADEQKTLEIRRNTPKALFVAQGVDFAPFKCYVYCTKGNYRNPHELLEIHSPSGKIYKANGMVIGEFTCDEILPVNVFGNGSIQDWNHHDLGRAFVPYDDMADYIGWGRTGYAWHISDFLLYDQPKELSEFCDRAPHSWCYIR